jgi:hypothetical protein
MFIHTVQAAFSPSAFRISLLSIRFAADEIHVLRHALSSLDFARLTNSVDFKLSHYQETEEMS